MKRYIIFLLALIPTVVCGDIQPIEFSDFSDPALVGSEAFTWGADTLLIGFDVAPDGSPISSGTVIDTLFMEAGVVFSALLTSGPYTGQTANTQALDYSVAPNKDPGDPMEAALSPPNILSAIDPTLGPTYTGHVAGTATLIIDFVTPDGEPCFIHSVGAFNDTIFGHNTLSAWSAPGGTGVLLGQVDATGPGNFMGLCSTDPIASITFSGVSTEIDDLVFSPHVVPMPSAILLSAMGLSFAGWRLRRRMG